jgi:hypothetical protein
MTTIDLLWGILVVTGAAALIYRGFRHGKWDCFGCPLSFCSRQHGGPVGVIQEQVPEHDGDESHL